MKNGSQAMMDNTTIMTTLMLKEKHCFDSDELFDFELEMEHYNNFI